jgi:cell division protein FtsI (penicillin-binding protein 3)
MNVRVRVTWSCKKEVPPQQAELIAKREFQGVYTEKNYKRYYPQPQPNAQIIGLTNSEGSGIEGLEMQLNQRLSGIDGEQQIVRDKKGNRFKDAEVVKEVEPGENITLSIDSRLQYIMYRELTAAGVANNARSATAIAVDVKTGEILAMASVGRRITRTIKTVCPIKTPCVTVVRLTLSSRVQP